MNSQLIIQPERFDGFSYGSVDGNAFLTFETDLLNGSEITREVFVIF